MISIRYFSVLISYDEEATFICYFILVISITLDRQSTNKTDRQADSAYVTFLSNHFRHVSAGWVMYILHSNLHKILHKRLVVVMYPETFWYRFDNIVRF